MSPAETIETLYAAFARRDGTAMAACYAPDAHFSDPVFTDLRGPQVGAMWTMLTTSGRDLEITLVQHDAASAHWLADYTFSRTGRRVHNDVRATFRFSADGLIVEHRDVFDLRAWAAQALGPAGRLLGWAPPFQKSVRDGAARTLASYMASASV